MPDDDQWRGPYIDVDEFLKDAPPEPEPEPKLGQSKPVLDEALVRWGIESAMIGVAWVDNDATYLASKEELDELAPWLTAELNESLDPETLAVLANLENWIHYAAVLKFCGRRAWHKYRVAKGKAKRIPFREEAEHGELDDTEPDAQAAQ